jgi:hypothetical protein
MLETALVTYFVLGLVLGALQLGLLGFLQITVDAGAFLNAHYNALGSSGSDAAFTSTEAASATTSVLPQIPSGEIGAPVVQAAPSPTVPVDYGYNGSQAEQQTAAGNRHGGASMMQPYIQQTAIDFVPLTFLNLPFRVNSQATEAVWLESTPEWDVTNSNYGSPYAGGNSAVNANYFSEGENTPPYYVSFNFVKHCNKPGDWGYPGSPEGQATCPSQNADFLSLGVAEHLDIYDWANPAAGTSGPVYSTGSTSTGTFEEMACHQRAFSKVADFFVAAKNASGGDPFNYLERNYNPYWYNSTQYGATYANFSGAKFFTQTAPSGAATSTSNADGAAGAAIGEIYSFDVERQTGPSNLGTNPGDNPLHPAAGCV